LWLQKFFNYGHKHNPDHDGLYFKYPWRAQKGIKLQSRQTRFEPGVQFPIPAGADWEKMLEETAKYADHLNSVYLECHHVATVTSFEYLKCKIHHMVDSITDRHTAEQAFKVA